MTLLQVAVFLMLLYEICEILSYKKLVEYRNESEAIKGSDITDTSKSIKLQELNKQHTGLLVGGMAYLLAIVALLFTPIWYLSVAIIALVIVNKVFKMIKVSLTITFIVDKVVSLSVIGYTLYKLFT